MQWNRHSGLQGQHAFLSASKYHWINYDEDKLFESFKNAKAAAHGSRLHAFAHECILLKQRLPDNNKTLNMYVNDAIRYRMEPEQLLYYSDNCFGTADTIGFREPNDIRGAKLRISDLKTGVSPASVKQLLVYAAMFCFEYAIPLGITPMEIEFELRIYQNDERQLFVGDPEEVVYIMDRIQTYSDAIDRWKAEQV